MRAGEDHDVQQPPLLRQLAVALLGLGLVAAVGLGIERLVSWVQRPDVMPLTRVVVDGGLEHLKREQLESVVTAAVTGNYITVDIEAVRRAAGALEWVEDATVQRVWPNTLVIGVRERAPFARWGESALVNRSGEVFRPSSLDGVGELPLLEGPDERGYEVVSRFALLDRIFRDAGHGQVQRLRLDDRGGWTLWLEQGPGILLGNEAVESRLVRVLRVLRLMGTDMRQLVTIDARYANGMAVRWKEAVDPTVETTAEVAG